MIPTDVVQQAIERMARDLRRLPSNYVLTLAAGVRNYADELGAPDPDPHGLTGILRDLGFRSDPWPGDTRDDDDDDD